jgi:3-hydroxyacyl-[acyl-carrier-protein] dehydratase
MIEGMYEIESLQPTAEGLEATLQLNREHAIYKAHFPGQPITPGVCVMQMMQDLLVRHYGRPLRLRLARNIKFLKVISPETTPQITYRLTMDGDGTEQVRLKVHAQVTWGDTLFAKMSSEYVFE